MCYVDCQISNPLDVSGPEGGALHLWNEPKKNARQNSASHNCPIMTRQSMGRRNRWFPSRRPQHQRSWLPSINLKLDVQNRVVTENPRRANRGSPCILLKKRRNERRGMTKISASTGNEGERRGLSTLSDVTLCPTCMLGGSGFQVGLDRPFASRSDS